jgi:DtxR family Mn-dependent transcriptional regulator
MTSDEQKPYSRKFEDYLESIYVIVMEKGYARTKDVSIALSITPASVAEMFRKLSDEELVVYRKYEGVTLTEKGLEIAKTVHRRHTILREFLEIINVPSPIADEDACIMEHHLSDQTIEQISNLVAFVKEAPHDPKWLSHYKLFCSTGEHQCTGEEGH